MTQSPVISETRDRVWYSKLSNPSELNGITEEVLEHLESACEAIERDQSLRALVVTGSEDVFSVGLHLRVLDRAFGDHAYFRSVLDRYNSFLFRLEALPVPVVAAVNGTCRAGGFELMLATDIAYVADQARIGDVHTPFGVMPGGGSTQRLPRLVGMQRAKDVILTGRWLDGREAYSLGLVCRSVPRAELDAAVEELLNHFRSASRTCLAEVKAAMRDGLGLDIKAAVRLETERFIAYLERSRDSTEGFRAYQEHRQPNWES